MDRKGKSSKCDLCIDTPYWNEKGGPGGKQACVESCPMKAIKFVAETPDQEETDGYNINLRNDHWFNLGLVDDSSDRAAEWEWAAVRLKPSQQRNQRNRRRTVMTGGYTGKILRVNLTNKSISTIPHGKYEEYGGGHGMGSAIFFDLVGDQLPFEAFDPRNLIIMMAHPFAGTFMPGSGRCEVQGLGPCCTRSNGLPQQLRRALYRPAEICRMGRHCG